MTNRSGGKATSVLLLSVLFSCAEARTPGEPGDSPAVPAPAPQAPTYQFGAKFEPPTGRVVHGMGQWEAYNPQYTALLNPKSQPASELIFLTIADTTRPWNPTQIAAHLAAIGAAGRIPLADIALRGNQPVPGTQLPDPLFGIDDEVAKSSTWDQRLLDLALVFAGYRKPALVRIGGEFNGAWNGYHPYDFPKAFRKIVNLFRSAGAGNVAFVWCYEPAAPGDFADQNEMGEFKWYPGEDMVDWFSIDLFASADLSGPPSGHGGSTSYGRALTFLDMAVASGKPVVIAESSPSQFDLSTAEGAGQVWSQWFTPYFSLITARPEIKWFTYINFDWTTSSYYLASGWKNNDLSAAPTIAAMYAQELAKPAYLHAGEVSLLKDYDLYK